MLEVFAWDSTLNERGKDISEEPVLSSHTGPWLFEVNVDRKAFRGKKN